MKQFPFSDKPPSDFSSSSFASSSSVSVEFANEGISVGASVGGGGGSRYSAMIGSPYCPKILSLFLLPNFCYYYYYFTPGSYYQL